MVGAPTCFFQTTPSFYIICIFSDVVTARLYIIAIKTAIMGLDLLPILPRALPSGSAVAVVGQRARPQKYCQNGRFFLLI
jgi:hypothetical protein